MGHAEPEHSQGSFGSGAVQKQPSAVTPSLVDCIVNPLKDAPHTLVFMLPKQENASATSHSEGQVGDKLGFSDGEELGFIDGDELGFVDGDADGALDEAADGDDDELGL